MYFIGLDVHKNCAKNATDLHVRNPSAKSGHQFQQWFSLRQEPDYDERKRADQLVPVAANHEPGEPGGQFLLRDGLRRGKQRLRLSMGGWTCRPPQSGAYYLGGAVAIKRTAPVTPSSLNQFPSKLRTNIDRIDHFTDVRVILTPERRPHRLCAIGTLEKVASLERD
jgi:hypothetical protein